MLQLTLLPVSLPFLPQLAPILWGENSLLVSIGTVVRAMMRILGWPLFSFTSSFPLLSSTLQHSAQILRQFHPSRCGSYKPFSYTAGISLPSPSREVVSDTSFSGFQNLLHREASPNSPSGSKEQQSHYLKVIFKITWNICYKKLFGTSKYINTKPCYSRINNWAITTVTQAIFTLLVLNVVSCYLMTTGITPWSISKNFL